MNEATEWALIICAIFVLGFIAGAILTLPFAFLGWLLISFVNLFGASVITSYFNCFVVGVVVPFIITVAAR